jgi:hypothetical protein
MKIKTRRYHLTLTIDQDRYKQKPKTTSVSKDVEILEPSDSAGRNVKWYNDCGKHSGSSSES